jgi:hypothetical protein
MTSRSPRQRWWLLGQNLILILGLLALTSAVQARPSGEAETPETLRLPLVMRGFAFAVGVVQGKVVDASTSQPLPGVRVCYGPSLCVDTASDGTYSLAGVPTGTQYLTATKEEYYMVKSSVLVTKDEPATLNFALSPSLNLGDIFMRIVVTWDSTPYWGSWPNDLDAHLWLSAPNPPTHVWLGYPGDCTTFPNACLETDKQAGSGPETMAVRTVEITNYYFGVLNYYHGYAGVPPITQLAVRVQLYTDAGLAAEYTVPSSGVGDFWYVFLMDQTGVVYPQNCIIDLPTEGTLPQCP